jgi:hypothetical protein
MSLDPILAPILPLIIAKAPKQNIQIYQLPAVCSTLRDNSWKINDRRDENCIISIFPLGVVDLMRFAL